jgi:Carbohydrate-binding module family 5/12
LEGVRAALKKRDDRFAVLEAKLLRLEAALEAKNCSYLGTFKEGKIYSPGQFVTHSGAMWHCNQHHMTTAPGNGHASWVLAVKSGRDGKDGKDAHP